jgi:hypothetical protein
VSRRRKPKGEPVKLAKVIPFERTVFAGGSSTSLTPYRTAADEYARLNLLSGRKPTLEELRSLKSLIEVALVKVIEEKDEFERGIGVLYDIDVQNALFQHALLIRLKVMYEEHAWVREELRKMEPVTPARVYDLAEYRRFRDRLVASRTEALG